MFKISLNLRNPQTIVGEGWTVENLAQDNFFNFSKDLEFFLNTDYSGKKEILKLKFANKKEFSAYCKNDLIARSQQCRECKEVHAFYWDILQACIKLKTNDYNYTELLSSIVAGQNQVFTFG
jgi:hypothetical protein